MASGGSSSSSSKWRWTKLVEISSTGAAAQAISLLDSKQLLSFTLYLTFLFRSSETIAPFWCPSPIKSRLQRQRRKRQQRQESCQFSLMNDRQTDRHTNKSCTQQFIWTQTVQAVFVSVCLFISVELNLKWLTIWITVVVVVMREREREKVASKFGRWWQHFNLVSARF